MRACLEGLRIVAELCKNLIASIQELHGSLHLLVLGVPTHLPVSLGEVEYCSRQIAAPAHLLDPISPGVPEHSPPNGVVVGQAAVLKDTLGVDSGGPGSQEAGHQASQEPQVHAAGGSSLGTWTNNRATWGPISTGSRELMPTRLYAKLFHRLSRRQPSRGEGVPSKGALHGPACKVHWGGRSGDPGPSGWSKRRDDPGVEAPS